MASAAHQYGALPGILKAYVDKTQDNYYENLFGQEAGYLKCEGKDRKTWAITYVQPRDMGAALEAVREGLAGMSVSDIPNALQFLQRVNTVYCNSLSWASPPPAKDVIAFNSRCQDVSKVFSNFFSSLLIFKDLGGEERIYPSSESAYQAHKIKLEDPDFSRGSGPDLLCEAESKTAAVTRPIVELNPLKAKKSAASQLKGKQKQTLTDSLAVGKYELMKEVVKAKLAANPFIRDKLNGSGKMFLVEKTPEASFWGGDPSNRSLRREKLPITKHSQNVLGLILMGERA